MTPKEKAEELIRKFKYILLGKAFANNLITEENLNKVKQCALIAVDEILENCLECLEKYWQEVRTEIERL